MCLRSMCRSSARSVCIRETETTLPGRADGAVGCHGFGLPNPCPGPIGTGSEDRTRGTRSRFRMETEIDPVVSSRTSRKRRCRRLRGLCWDVWLENRVLLAGHALAMATPVVFTPLQTAAESGFLSSAGIVDLYAVTLSAGDTMTAAVDTQTVLSGLDSALQVFDPSGTPIAANDDANGRDPALSFQASATGTYYLGVSGSGAASAGDAVATGMYRLLLSKKAEPLRPDVVVAAVGADQDTVVPGQTITLHYTIENRGGAGSQAFQVDVRGSDHNGFDATQPPLATFLVPGLASGGSVTGTLSVALDVATTAGADPPQVFLGLKIHSADAAPRPTSRDGRRGADAGPALAGERTEPHDRPGPGPAPECENQRRSQRGRRGLLSDHHDGGWTPHRARPGRRHTDAAHTAR